MLERARSVRSASARSRDSRSRSAAASVSSCTPSSLARPSARAARARASSARAASAFCAAPRPPRRTRRVAMSWFALNPLRHREARERDEPTLSNSDAGPARGRPMTPRTPESVVVVSYVGCKSFTGGHIDARLPLRSIATRRSRPLRRARWLHRTRGCSWTATRSARARLRAQRAHRRPRREQRLRSRGRVAGVIFPRSASASPLSPAAMLRENEPTRPEKGISGASEKFPFAPRPTPFFFLFCRRHAPGLGGTPPRDSREILKRGARCARSLSTKKSSAPARLPALAAAAPPPRRDRVVLRRRAPSTDEMLEMEARDALGCARPCAHRACAFRAPRGARLRRRRRRSPRPLRQPRSSSQRRPRRCGRRALSSARRGCFSALRPGETSCAPPSRRAAGLLEALRAHGSSSARDADRVRVSVRHPAHVFNGAESRGRVAREIRRRGLRERASASPCVRDVSSDPSAMAGGVCTIVGRGVARRGNCRDSTSWCRLPPPRFFSFNPRTGGVCAAPHGHTNGTKCGTTREKRKTKRCRADLSR